MARKLRKDGNLSEVLLWQQVKKRQVQGYKFLRQKPIGNYIVDFFCKELMLAVEIDGDSHDHKMEADRIRQKNLEAFGVRFLRFLDRDVKNNLEGVVLMIHQRVREIENAQKHPPGPPQDNASWQRKWKVKG